MTLPTRDLRFLLLQVRNPDDPMRRHEITCFERGFGLVPGQVEIFDLLRGAPDAKRIESVDVVLLGGSGDYSVARGGPWLPAALEAMVGLYEMSTPTFASCWGFQAMARAMGGSVVTDHARAEVGATWLDLTDAGRSDPVFGPLAPRFQAVSGHEDIVVTIPASATLLASSERVENQAFHFPGKPIYCTQFHPELTRSDLLERISRYPAYLPLAGASTVDELAEMTPELDHVGGILKRFLDVAFGRRAPTSDG
ncbi:MAG: type 1 glutamine amidotransferase [Gemmatimonadota bacterium]|nr:type 1 glutamine amidotransferase [Gemmatimonadota bacterium]MDH3424674.1 type 1 glutamine amidotransferase [Gemmatimonadota bacterium]